MMASLTVQVHAIEHDTPPPHHVVVEGTQDLASSKASSSTTNVVPISPNIERFRNPWASWYKPRFNDYNGVRDLASRFLEWGEDRDPCIDLAVSHLKAPDDRSKRLTTSQKAAVLLQTQRPDFTFNHVNQQARVTWLGHAGVLVQFRPLRLNGRAIRCLFDPIFSMRCSPTQTSGPYRTYPAPCTVKDLPPLDLVVISHDHYDHYDYDTIKTIWKEHKDTVRFVVPLRVTLWFKDCGVPSDRVTELDWWDSISVSDSNADNVLRLTCTPSQHNSGGPRVGANISLWSSWYVDHPSGFRTFFAGDTGFQFHDAPDWPPSPIATTAPKAKRDVDDKDVNGTKECCPAFKLISQKLGSPHLLILPVAVGATFDYLRSWVPLPDSISPFPRHRPGLTAANHMPPWDAVRVMRIMTDERDSRGPSPVAVAMHWGTFVPNPSEVLKTLGQLEWACDQHGIRFAREIDADQDSELPLFLALNHGQSIDV